MGTERVVRGIREIFLALTDVDGHARSQFQRIYVHPNTTCTPKSQHQHTQITSLRAGIQPKPKALHVPYVDKKIIVGRDKLDIVKGVCKSSVTMLYYTVLNVIISQSQLIGIIITYL
ncbi:hypothetical protein EDB19DRAFT_2025790 [Suillus lakei]|nr:hypothetical protein EDB19DRAFT_2025790 [Suillus lakei]